jgi:hypothetical protein
MDDLISAQSGVVSRSQLLSLALTRHDIARLLRRRELVAIHPGVYLDHTGRPSPRQEEWAAVLAYHPAALGGAAAVAVHEGRSRQGPIELVVARDRKITRRPGIVLRRNQSLFDQVRWDLHPPRLRYEDAVVDAASRARREVDAVALVTAAVQGRWTTPARLSAALGRRNRLPRRGLISAVLDDLLTGIGSALEHGYVHRVERPHLLVPARRQVKDRIEGRVVYRDFDYGPVVVEVDGRAYHASAHQRDRDLDRDLASACGGRVTLRVSWGQVYERACWTAAQVVGVLGAHGVRSGARPCSPGCPVPVDGFGGG